MKLLESLYSYFCLLTTYNFKKNLLHLSVPTRPIGKTNRKNCFILDIVWKAPKLSLSSGASSQQFLRNIFRWSLRGARNIVKKNTAQINTNIILSVSFLYKKIYYITNIALKNHKCVINIVKRHRWEKRSSHFICNTCCAPANSVVIGGLHFRSHFTLTMVHGSRNMEISLEKLVLHLPWKVKAKFLTILRIMKMSI
jgi:hypothetical protein